MNNSDEILVAVVMGSKSDWEEMRPASEVLSEFDIPHQCRVLSAHRTPDPLSEFIKHAESKGCKVFIAGAGGAAHLAGVIASQTLRPVLGVPIQSALLGLDSLLSTVQMPGGIPVGTMAIGKAGAMNAALMATAILGVARPEFLEKIQAFRDERAQKILSESLPEKQSGMGFKR